jgi:hypothetical protein
MLEHKKSIYAAIITLAFAPTACGDPSTSTDAATCDEDVALAAELVLEQNCYPCHGRDGTANGNMNFIMDAEQLVERDLVIPNDPVASRIYARMMQDTMPPVGVSTRPDEAARESVRKWIECGAPAFAEADSSRGFVSPDEVLSLLRVDIDLLPSADRQFARYLSLVNLHNDPSVSEESLSTYRHALNKQVNDLSASPMVKVPQPIDGRQILYRIDLRDYRWEAQANGEDLWELMVRQYPYGVHPPDQADAAYLHQQTASLMPVMNTDWFVFASSEPPLYYDMLRVPATIAELKQRLGVVPNGPSASAGVVKSGVALQNRVVRRLVSQFGVLWESADFGSSIDDKNILEHPLPLGSGFPGFEHVPDGGEYIFSLPNGLHGYLITDAIGNVIDEAPPSIVFDPNDPFGGTVRSGRKCSKCHAEGINPATDRVLDHVLSSGVFPQAVVDRVEAEYPTVDVFDALVAEDREAFLAARAETGIPDNVQGNDSVPISFLANAFQGSVDIDRAAADFGVSVESLRTAIENSDDLRRSLGQLLADEGELQRETFRDAFAAAVCTMNLGEPMIDGVIVPCDQVPQPGEQCGCQNPNNNNDPSLPFCVQECSGTQVLSIDQCGIVNFALDCATGLICKVDPLAGTFCG